LVLIKAYNVDKTSKVITEKEKKALKKWKSLLYNQVFYLQLFMH
jgi:hypothetical protein